MQVLNIFHVLIAIAMVALVLVQRGAGATAGAAFGSGASGTVFGARGAGNFLTRSTWILATLFCAISLTMAVVVSRTSTTPETDLGVVANVPAVTEQTGERAGGEQVEPEMAPPATEQAPADLPPVEFSDEAGESAAAEDLPAFDGSGEDSGEDAASVDAGSAGDDS